MDRLEAEMGSLAVASCVLVGLAVALTEGL